MKQTFIPMLIILSSAHAFAKDAYLDTLPCRLSATIAAEQELAKAKDGKREYQAAMFRRSDMSIDYSNMSDLEKSQGTLALTFRTQDDGWAEFLVVLDPQCNVKSVDFEDSDN